MRNNGKNWQLSDIHCVEVTLLSILHVLTHCIFISTIPWDEYWIAGQETWRLYNVPLDHTESGGLDQNSKPGSEIQVRFQNLNQVPKSMLQTTVFYYFSLLSWQVRDGQEVF